MALAFPASPSNGNRTILAGKEYIYSSPKWLRFSSVIIDSGFSTTVITLDNETVDGGDVDGV